MDEICELIKRNNINKAKQLADKVLLERYLASISNGDIDDVIFMIEDKLINPGDHDSIGLIRACQTGQLNIVKYLIEYCKINVATDDNLALQSSVYNGYIDIVKFLIKLKEIDIKVDNCIILIHAVNSNNLEMVKLVTISLLSIDKKIPKDTVNRAFISACNKDCKCDGINCTALNIVKYLANFDINPAAENNQAIILAAKNGHLEMIKFLLTLKNVDPSADHNKALRLACYYGHLEIVKYLLTLDKVDAKDNDYQAFKWAAAEGRLVIIEYLISLGIYHSDGIKRAKQNGHNEVVSVLNKSLKFKEIKPNQSHLINKL